MSAERNPAAWLLGALLIACGVALAADEALPDAAFLEYLGMWEGPDDEWLALDDDGRRAAEPEERVDPAPAGEESTEKVR